MTNSYDILDKPAVGVAGGLGGGVASISTWCGLLTPIVGFLATVLGLFIVVYHCRIVYVKWQKAKRIDEYFCRHAPKCPTKLPIEED